MYWGFVDFGHNLKLDQQNIRIQKNQIIRSSDTADGNFFCGGSLISSQWILTAAHCLYTARHFTIYVGSNTLQSADPNRVILATSVSVVYPGFDPLSLEHDIGLIKLHAAVTFNEYIQPIQIALSGDIVEGLAAIASGWGQISDTIPGIVNDLYYTNVVIISNVECKLTYGNQIKDSMICAVGNYNEGICLGDTGGPLVVEKGLNQFIQIGISGFYSQQGCELLHPSGFTRTDAYTEWIQNVTQIK